MINGVRIFDTVLDGKKSRIQSQEIQLIFGSHSANQQDGTLAMNEYTH
jgi:hypothetical protein